MSNHNKEEFLCSVYYATTDVMKVTTTCGHQLCFNCTSNLVCFQKKNVHIVVLLFQVILKCQMSIAIVVQVLCMEL